MQVDIFQNFHGQVIISKHGVNSKKSDQAKISKHLIQWTFSKVPSHCFWIFCLEVSSQLLIDVGLFNQRIEYIEYTQNTPNVAVVFEVLNFFCIQSGWPSKLRERLKLIDKLIDDFPQPLICQSQVDRLRWSWRKENQKFFVTKTRKKLPKSVRSVTTVASQVISEKSFINLLRIMLNNSQ